MCGTRQAARYYASDGLLGDAVSSSDYVELQDYEWPGKPFAWRAEEKLWPPSQDGQTSSRKRPNTEFYPLDSDAGPIKYCHVNNNVGFVVTEFLNSVFQFNASFGGTVYHNRIYIIWHPWCDWMSHNRVAMVTILQWISSDDLGT